MAKPLTYRLVESVREGQQVKQRALLNLGADFAIEPKENGTRSCNQASLPKLNDSYTF